MERLTNFWGNLKKCVECAENSNCYSNNSCDHIANAIAKLRDYEDLEEQGKLLKLPVAVGDTVYEICEGFIEPCTVEVIYIADYRDNDGNFSYMAEIDYDRKDCPWVSTEIYLTDIGKTVFLTHEAAEAALKEMRERQGKDMEI